MLTSTTLPLWIVGMILLLYVSSVVIQGPYLLKMWLYPTAREITKAATLYKMDELIVQESPHFIIKYRAEDAEAVAMVLMAAETAYQPVTESLGHQPPGKATIVIASSRQEMQQTFGWSSDQSAMGVFWAGIIEVLSPKIWIKGADVEAQTADFLKNGPIAHEFTHLVVDSMARGNYPRWFTEGLAQYQEYKLNGYEWITAKNSLGQDLYTLEYLEREFDMVGNQSLAYRESFAAVRYIYEVYGDASVQQILQQLNKGKSMRMAVKTVLGLEYSEYEMAWQDWAREHMAHPAK